MSDLDTNGLSDPNTPEPDWKTAFTGVMRQRNEWMNRAQNLELDLYLMEEKLKAATTELESLKTKMGDRDEIVDMVTPNTYHN
jgi:hypothetical protein